MWDNKRVAKIVKKLKGKKIGWKWKTDRPPTESAPQLGPRGGIKGGVNPSLGNEGIGGMLESRKKATSIPPVAQRRGGILTVSVKMLTGTVEILTGTIKITLQEKCFSELIM